MDELERIFMELFQYREGFVNVNTKPLERAAKIISNKKKSPKLIEFIESLPKGPKFFVDIGPWYNLFGHELFKRNPKLLENVYFIGVDSGLSRKSPLKHYEKQTLENLEEIKYKGKCIFRLENFKEEHHIYVNRNFPNNITIYGTEKNDKNNLGDYNNITKLFTKEFLERKIDVIFVRRMFQYIPWERFLGRTSKFTKAYSIIDYSKRNLCKEKMLTKIARVHLGTIKKKPPQALSKNYIKKSLYRYRKTLENIPYPEKLNTSLKKRNFKIHATKENNTYFYTLAKR